MTRADNVKAMHKKQRPFKVYHLPAAASMLGNPN